MRINTEYRRRIYRADPDDEMWLVAGRRPKKVVEVGSKCDRLLTAAPQSEFGGWIERKSA